MVGNAEKLGRVSLGTYFVRLKPLDCWAAIGAAKFFVVLVCLNVRRRGWLLKAVWFCALAGEANPTPTNRAAQITLRTISPPFCVDDLVRYSGFMRKVAEDSNCNRAVKAKF